MSQPDPMTSESLLAREATASRLRRSAAADGRRYLDYLYRREWARIDGHEPAPPRRLSVYSDEWAQIRTVVFKRDNYTCQYCGKSGVRLECDHVIPVCRGGLDGLGNLKTACKPCNRSKSGKTLEEWQQ